MLTRANERLKEVERRDEAQATLAGATAAEPLATDCAWLRSAWSEATQAGVNIDVLQEAQQKLRAAIAAQRPRDMATNQIKRLTSEQPLSLDVIYFKVWRRSCSRRSGCNRRESCDGLSAIYLKVRKGTQR